MALFKIDNQRVTKVTTKELDLEKHLQELFEKNLSEILNITFLAHEYSTSFGGRIDTLGIDKTGSPCIIEYKKNQNDNNILYLDTETYQKVKVSTSKIARRATQNKEKIVVLQKDYSIESHLEKASDEIKTLFQVLREKILALDEDIKEEPQKFYVAYKLSTNFADVEFYKNHLKTFLNVKSGGLKDPRSLARDMENPKHIGHHGNGDYEVRLESEKDMEDVFALIKQSYDFNK